MSRIAGPLQDWIDKWKKELSQKDNPKTKFYIDDSSTISEKSFKELSEYLQNITKVIKK